MISTAERLSRVSTSRSTLRMAVGDGHVEPCERFVEHQHVGLGRQRPGQRHALSLSPRELARHPVGEIGGADLAQPVRGRRA